MEPANRSRVVIEHIEPEIDCGRFSIKRVVGENVTVKADIFSDGHGALSARLRYRKKGDPTWSEAPMRLVENDRWEGEFVVDNIGVYQYAVDGWNDAFKTWKRDLKKKIDAGEFVPTDVTTGVHLIEETAERASQKDRETLLSFARVLRSAEGREDILCVATGQGLTELMSRYPERGHGASSERELSVCVDRRKALFSAWYEFFPRSASPDEGRRGTLKDCEALLPEIASMGFDTLYLPPIHPIGKTNRKGRDNVMTGHPDDVGSPWAIGSEEGGHKAVHPQLGTTEDFDALVARAKEHGIEIAMDLAFQCSPDHPYLKEHPEWFRWRPDGTIQFAENPPKKYEDIVPLHFETEQWQALWDELKSVALYWIEHGIRIFRVDNPHTKPFAFWEWLIREVKEDYPETIFLSEAFTRPRVMHRLAKLGFTQSYTYFTWRNTKKELTEYLTELTQTEVKEFFRPNFWPNTPDILPEYLQYGGRPAFMTRLVLAATLSSNYGVYGPAYELMVQSSIPGKEEYLHSEKYEMRRWERDRPGSLKDFIARVNQIRKENPALQTLWNLSFEEADNDALLFYRKATEDLSNIILVLANLDPYHTQSGWVKVSLKSLHMDVVQPYLVHDLLSDEKYIWHGERNYVILNPQILPVSILRVSPRLRREADFDYFM
jgi:starch synthase (maltosyl-transferring)